MEGELLVHGTKQQGDIVASKITAAQNDVALSYYRVRGLYFLAVVFVATIERVAGTADKTHRRGNLELKF